MTLWSSGSNAKGQLATGDDEDAHTFKPALFDHGRSHQPSTPGAVLQIACGANHTLALIRVSSDYSTVLWGSGDGSRGQLGEGYIPEMIFKQLSLGPSLGSSEITTVQASWETSFIVARSATNDRILSFGSNDFGLRGGGEKDLDSISNVSFRHLFSPSVTSFRVTHIKAGPRNVLAVIAFDSPGEGQREMLIGWGAGRNGQLEVRDPMDWNRPSSKIEGPRRISSPIRITTWAHPTKVLDISVGYQHALVLTNDGYIVQLGSNSKSQLPSERPLGHAVRVLCTWNNSFIALKDSSHLWMLSYGRNSHGQLGIRDASMNIVSFPETLQVDGVVCGSEHSLVTGNHDPSGNLEVWGWGWNEHGNLAMGHTQDVTVPTRMSLPSNGQTADAYHITGVWAGCGTSWVATSS